MKMKFVSLFFWLTVLLAVTGTLAFVYYTFFGYTYETRSHGIAGAIVVMLTLIPMTLLLDARKDAKEQT